MDYDYDHSNALESLLIIGRVNIVDKASKSLFDGLNSRIGFVILLFCDILQTDGNL